MNGEMKDIMAIVSEYTHFNEWNNAVNHVVRYMVVSFCLLRFVWFVVWKFVACTIVSDFAQPVHHFDSQQHSLIASSASAKGFGSLGVACERFILHV